MPRWLQTVSRLNPLTYAINTIRDLILNGLDWGLFARMSAVLLAVDVGMILITLWVSRRVIE
jgi:ABC-type multidrug transport system permease subunit